MTGGKYLLKCDSCGHTFESTDAWLKTHCPNCHFLSEVTIVRELVPETPDESEDLGPIQQLGACLAALVVGPIVALYGFKAAAGFLGFLGEIHSGEIVFTHPIFKPIVWLIVVVCMLVFAVLGIAGALVSIASLVMLVALPFVWLIRVLVWLKRVLTGDQSRNGPAGEGEGHIQTLNPSGNGGRGSP